MKAWSMGVTKHVFPGAPSLDYSVVHRHSALHHYDQRSPFAVALLGLVRGAISSFEAAWVAASLRTFVLRYHFIRYRVWQLYHHQAARESHSPYHDAATPVCPAPKNAISHLSLHHQRQQMLVDSRSRHPPPNPHVSHQIPSSRLPHVRSQ